MASIRLRRIMGRLIIKVDSIPTHITVLLRKKLSRTFFGLTTLSLAISAIPSLFSEYNPTFSHTVKHSFFILAILASATMLNIDKFPKFFQSIHDSIELGVFDKFQYVLAYKVKSVANIFRKSQTGNLNVNMLYLLMGLAAVFIIWLIV